MCNFREISLEKFRVRENNFREIYFINFNIFQILFWKLSARFLTNGIIKCINLDLDLDI